MKNSRIAISAETTVDLSKELADRFDIHIIPLTVLLGERLGFDGEITPDDIFEYGKTHKDLPKTGAVNEFQFEEHFKKLLEEYDYVIHISISSKLSSCYSNACKAAEKVGNVSVIDSLNLSTGIALLCIYASTLAEKGKEPKEIVELVEKRKSKAQSSFYVETIDYLYKGGRCSTVKMIGAKILRIKPQIIVNEQGEMELGSKYFGRKTEIAIAYCKDVLKKFTNPDKSLIFITHTHALEIIVDAVKKFLNDCGFKNIFETFAGATITSHCGQGTLGILFFSDGVNTL